MVWYAAKSVEMTPSMRYAKKFAFGKIQQWGIIGDKWTLVKVEEGSWRSRSSRR